MANADWQDDIHMHLSTISGGHKDNKPDAFQSFQKLSRVEAQFAFDQHKFPCLQIFSILDRFLVTGANIPLKIQFLELWLY